MARPKLLLVVGAATVVFAVQLLWTNYELDTLRSHRARGGAPPEPAAPGGQGREAGGAAGGALPAGLHPPKPPAIEARPMASPAVIVFCYDRPDYLLRTLASLAGLAGLERYSVYISQDGRNASVAAAVQSMLPRLRAAARSVEHWQRPRVPELGPDQPGHAWLTQHYRWGLARLFAPGTAAEGAEEGGATGAGPHHSHSHGIILEDDMLLSPDFLAFFEAAAPVLSSDPSLWCVSSWNDNGLAAHHGWDPARMFRTSYFPGLGWMLTRELWQELAPKWPKDHWDHWMRVEATARGRECVAPELNRNKNIGEVGANMDRSSFRRNIAGMAWHNGTAPVDWGDLSYLVQPGYGEGMAAAVDAAAPLPAGSAAALKPGVTYLVPYVAEEYARLARRYGVWPYPRAHHRHVASVPYRGARLLLADRRFCALLPEPLRLRPSPGLAAVPAQRGQQCLEACAAAGLRCQQPDFWFVNNCTALRQHFPCAAGCTVEMGDDIPAFVSDPGASLAGYCLTSQRPSTCAAFHHSTSRLCACVPAVEARPAGGGEDAPG